MNWREWAIAVVTEIDAPYLSAPCRLATRQVAPLLRDVRVEIDAIAIVPA